VPRPTRLPIALCALALAGGGGLAVAGTSAASASSPVAHAARNCGSTSNEGSLRGGYYQFLVVSGTTCSAGQKVQVAYQNCRLKSGLSGRCHAKVLGYTCKEQRQSISIQITAKVSCTHSHRKINYTYQQNLV
jgi:hypothetical protein